MDTNDVIVTAIKILIALPGGILAARKLYRWIRRRRNVKNHR